MTQSLNSIAKAAYTDSAAKVDTESAENEATAAAEFLDIARRCAKDVLGEAADGLPWRYTPWADAAADTEEAIAALAPGRAHNFALHYVRTEDTTTFALAAACVSCGCRTVTPVASLQHLGQLLEEADGQDVWHGDDDTVTDEGPLAPVERLESKAALVAGLLRRMLARHPEAGLSVEFASAYGHHAGVGAGILRLAAENAEAVMDVVQVLGDEAVVTISDGGHGAYAYRWARVSLRLDDVEVEISGATLLSEEETAAWRAEQHQADTNAPEIEDSELTPAVAETGGDR